MLIIVFAAYRAYYVRKHGKEENTLKKREGGMASKIASTLGPISFISNIVSVIQPDWLSRASLPFLSGCAGQNWVLLCLDFPCCNGRKIHLAKIGAIHRA